MYSDMNPFFLIRNFKTRIVIAISATIIYTGCFLYLWL